MTHTTTDLTALVLAGGPSTRMGQDKALLTVGGVSLLRQVCEVAATCSDRVLVVTPWVERYAEQVPVGCDLMSEGRSPDAAEAPGPLVAFAQALPHIQTAWVLLLACDLPRLTAEVLQEWAAQRAHVSPKAIALLPRQAKGWEPLCGFYRRSCQASLAAFVQQGGRSFQRWLASQVVQPLPLNDPGLVFNCNTPDDYRQINPSGSIN